MKDLYKEIFNFTNRFVFDEAPTSKPTPEPEAESAAPLPPAEAKARAEADVERAKKTETEATRQYREAQARKKETPLTPAQLQALEEEIGLTAQERTKKAGEREMTHPEPERPRAPGRVKFPKLDDVDTSTRG